MNDPTRNMILHDACSLTYGANCPGILLKKACPILGCAKVDMDDHFMRIRASQEDEKNKNNQRH